VAINRAQITSSTVQGVNFINVKHTNFLYKHHFGSFYFVYETREKLLKRRSYEKNCTFNVDEIDTWRNTAINNLLGYIISTSLAKMSKFISRYRQSTEVPKSLHMVTNPRNVHTKTESLKNYILL
jgi:hypothetical protein